jgi:imidazoleglycerol phosphate synthase glutamine amidotransferase subunit HisH
MRRIQSLRFHAAREVSLSGAEEHMRQMPYSLLPPRHETKSQSCHALLRTTHVTTPSRVGVAPRMGWTNKTAKTGKENNRQHEDISCKNKQYRLNSYNQSNEKSLTVTGSYQFISATLPQVIQATNMHKTEKS